MKKLQKRSDKTWVRWLFAEYYLNQIVEDRAKNFKAKNVYLYAMNRKDESK